MLSIRLWLDSSLGGMFSLIECKQQHGVCVMINTSDVNSVQGHAVTVQTVQMFLQASRLLVTWRQHQQHNY